MHVAVLLLSLVGTVLVVAWVSQRLGWTTPLVLVAVGAVVGLVPGVPSVVVAPEVVLTGLLPPLLYASALQLSLFDFRRNRLPVLLLSVGAVVFSTAAVGLVTWAVVPALGIAPVGLAAAFALGAVVAPPDAVAATAVGKRIGMPRRVTALLEDESLLNDATALALLTTAVLAVSRPVTVADVVGRFALAAVGGVVVGLVAGVVLSAVRRRIDDPVLDTALSFAAPYVAYLPAEAVGGSGVLAVVVTGLLLARRATDLQSASSRVVERVTWRTVAFLLENVVFLLIGLQLPQLLAGVARTGPPWPDVVVVCAAVAGSAVLARAVFVFACAVATRVLPQRPGRDAWPWPVSAVLSWSGMRGVVTLAASAALPEDTPQRDVLRLAAFCVVAVTLYGQGLTLPLLVRRLGLRGPDPSEDALQAASVVDTASRAGLLRLDEMLTGDEPDDVVDNLRQRAMGRANSAWERLGRPDPEQATPSEIYRRLRVGMLTAERDSILEARDTGRWDDEVLRSALSVVDLEESLLDRRADAEQGADRADELVSRVAEQCDHLRDAPYVVPMSTADECEDCVREGTSWVHLRGCLTCGHVGCCDSSPRRHADRHFHATGHPVMRSVEPGEAWRWCYVDELVG